MLNGKSFLEILECVLNQSRYPDSVTVKDIAGSAPSDGTSTPAEEPDFFTDFDKPMIKRPTPPVSRTATPGAGRTPSPFLSAGNGNGNGINRAPSPLGSTDKPAAPAASRTTSSAALRKTAVGAGPRKANVLGAKKTKLGAKKVTGEVIDFDAAEKKAKEEAERIEKLGYDPEDEEAVKKAAAEAAPKIVAPTPLSPGRAGFGTTQAKRTDGELERLGMGMGRLGFGQMGASKPAAPAAKKMGFGSVGSTKIVQECKIPPFSTSGKVSNQYSR